MPRIIASLGGALLGALLALAAGDATAQSAKMGETPPAPKGVHYLYFIRHGEYAHDGSADDVSGNHLNALGHEQAKLTGERIAKFPFKVDRLVCSNFARARETAEDIGGILAMTPVVDTLIHECTATSDRADLMKHPEEVAACDSNLAAAWRKYAVPSPTTDTHDVLVCHGNVTRWFTARAMGADPRHWIWMDIANGSITVIVIRADGTTKLATFSDSGHIPLDKQTWTGKGAGWMPPKK